MIPAGPDWTGALCAQTGIGDAWFPEKGGRNDRAVRICQACPIQRECLEYALSIEGGRHTRWGVWGGTVPETREQIARERAA